MQRSADRFTVKEITCYQTRRRILRVDVWTAKGQSSQTCNTVGEARAFFNNCVAKASKA